MNDEGKEPLQMEALLGERLERLQQLRQREATVREAKRAQQVADEAERKKATKRWREQRIETLQNQHNAYGIARIYLHGKGSEALQANVRRHVQSMARSLASRDGLTYEAALEQVEARLRDVIEEVEGQ